MSRPKLILIRLCAQDERGSVEFRLRSLHSRCVLVFPDRRRQAIVLHTHDTFGGGAQLDARSSLPHETSA